MRVRSSAVVAIAAVLLAPFGGPALGPMLGPVLGPVLGPAPALAAGSDYPSAGQVRQARQAAAAKAAQIRQVKARLVDLTTRLSAAQATLVAAARAYDRAELLLDQRTQAARLAQAHLDRAEASLRGAQAEAGHLAVEAYRNGGDGAGVDALLTSTGPQDLLDRELILRHLASRQARVLQRVDSARVASALLQRQADLALAQQRRAAADAARTRTRARASVNATTATVAQARTQQKALVTQLAHLEQISLALERRRQAALQAQAEAAARAASTASATVAPQAVAQTLAARRGWDAGQFGCLVRLWTRESRWFYRATNPVSGAYGIPQSLPPRKMASAGPDWKTNPTTQIRWGLQYIASAYGTPCAAWAHEQAHDWY